MDEDGEEEDEGGGHSYLPIRCPGLTRILFRHVSDGQRPSDEEEDKPQRVVDTYRDAE